MSVRAIIVGEDNPHSADPKDALYPYPPNCAGERLQRLVFDVSLGTYLRDYERVNLCASGRWKTSVARERAHEIGIRAQVLDAKIVMLGRKVADALDAVWTGVPRELFTASATGSFVLLPHPSGRCREWNDPTSFERARKVLRAAGVI